MSRATLGEIRTAVASAAAYQRYAKVGVVEAVEVVCDYQGITDDRDRRIVRNGLIHHEQAPGNGRRAAG